MFGPHAPQRPQLQWGFHRSPHNSNSQWRPHFRPRAAFRGQHHQFNGPRAPFQSQNDNYWCETCDRGFPTEDILNNHKQQHQKCNIDGCQFIAHPKVITKHIQMQHSTGLYKKIANLKNPEDIEKWREERRRKYPTKVNIEKKAAELREKIDRGEKMGLPRERKKRNNLRSEENRKPDQGTKRKFNSLNENPSRSKFKKNKGHKENQSRNPSQNNSQKPDFVDDNRLKPFAGIANLQIDSDHEIENNNIELNSLIEDEDEIKEIEITKSNNENEPIVCGALSSLMCDYGSSEEEDNTEVTSKTLVIQPTKDLVTVEKSRPAKSDVLDLKMCNDKENQESSESKDIVLNESINTHEAELKTISLDSQNITNRNAKQENEITETSETVWNEAFQNCEKTGTELSKPCISEDERNSGHENAPKDIHNDPDDDSGPEEMKVEIRKDNPSEVVDNSKQTNLRRNTVKGLRNRGNGMINQHRRKLPSTLLQKLLQKEMQQERNIVLQCIRYITRNNYFDKKE